MLAFPALTPWCTSSGLYQTNVLKVAGAQLHRPVSSTCQSCEFS